MATTYTTQGLREALDVVTAAPVAGPMTVILMNEFHLFTGNPSFLVQIVGDEYVSDGYARQLVTWDAMVDQDDGRVTRDAKDTVIGIVGTVLPAITSGCYLFGDTGDPNTSPVIQCVQWSDPLTSDGTTMTVRWPPQFGMISPSRF